MKAKLTGVVVGLFLGLLVFRRRRGAIISLTVEPITWDVIGLDSNAPTAGPKYFPVGVRITNTSGSPIRRIDGNLQLGSEPAYEIAARNFGDTQSRGTLAAAGTGDSVDAYFEVEITQEAAAIGTYGSYYIRGTRPGSGTRTPGRGTCTWSAWSPRTATRSTPCT